MSELSEVLARLGLSQYLGRLTEEGFEKWETVLDITELDLAALNFKLGHRRILQREIGSARGLPANQPLSSNQFSPFEELEEKPFPHGYKTDAGKGSTSTGKRKYRRHPKPDDNAPEKPPSAYVMFANRVRDELKGRNLSFTDIAKLVGEKWKVLDPEDKESYEFEASVAKEKYTSELQTYKQTEKYRAYVKYLADFKSKMEGKENTELSESSRKRPKLESLPSTSSMGTISTAGSAGSAASGLSATAPPMNLSKMPALGSGIPASVQSAYNPPPAPTPSSLHASGIQSMPANPSPLSPVPPAGLGGDAAYRDAWSRAAPFQEESGASSPAETDSHYFPRIHPATVQSPHIQHSSSYLRHQPASAGQSTRSASILPNPSLRRHGIRLDDQYSPTAGSISGTISSSCSSSAPSLTPLTPALDEASRGTRSLPLPQALGASPGSGYFDQRSNSYQPPSSQPTASRTFAPPSLGQPSYPSPAPNPVPESAQKLPPHQNIK